MARLSAVFSYFDDFVGPLALSTRDGRFTALLEAPLLSR